MYRYVNNYVSIKYRSLTTHLHLNLTMDICITFSFKILYDNNTTNFRNKRMFRSSFSFLLSILFLSFFNGSEFVASLPLDDYMNNGDSSYSYTDTGVTFTGKSLKSKIPYTGYVLNMTSQTWLTEADIPGKSVWWHLMAVIVPDNLPEVNNIADGANLGGLWITGDSNNDNGVDPKSEDVKVTAELAVLTKSITAALFQVPNAPIIFAEDPSQKARTEDAIIAWTWHHYINNPDTSNEWPLRLPMTKAGVRAIDTVVDFADKKFGRKLDDFVVAGASKRGWTTYFVAAVDKRVRYMVPIVMDMLNLLENIHHQYKAYGGWTFAFKDYYELDILGQLDSDAMKKMANEIVDPIIYNDRWEGTAKLIVNSANDEFFMPDDTLFWWDQLTEPKHWLLAPNTEHSMATGILEVIPAISTWVRNQVENGITSIPDYDWKVDTNSGNITLKIDPNTPPTEIHLWHANTCNSKRRDFRIVNLDDPCPCGIRAKGMCANLGVLWKSEKLDDKFKVADGVWEVSREPLDDGRWTAFFLDVTFSDKKNPHTHGWPIDRMGNMEFTTGVSIIPNTFPYPDCVGEECQGTLV